jgi:hypothetical protein
MINPLAIPRDRPVFSDPTPEDLRELAANIRQPDADELRLSHAIDPLRAATLAVRVSDHTVAARLDGRLVALFGVRADCLADRTALVWALGTREIDRRPAPFLRWSPRALLAVADCMPEARTFHNAVWEGHRHALRWLAWLGADFGTPYAAGPSSATFLPFTIERTALCAHQ